MRARSPERRNVARRVEPAFERERDRDTFGRENSALRIQQCCPELSIFEQNEEPPCGREGCATVILVLIPRRPRVSRLVAGFVQQNQWLDHRSRVSRASS